jgi:ubiquinone/menaquinone biosynthesis C-methylase UbiE
MNDGTRIGGRRELDDAAQRKRRVQRQFGVHAERYATSPVHARGQSLRRMLALTDPQPGDRLLDVAAAAGHTAMQFASHVGRVVAVDLTPETIAVARRLAEERSVDNVIFVRTDAEQLPFPANAFDLVTCRLALHHMPDAGHAVAEMARVCCESGQVALADNVVPDNPDTAAWINTFESIRDPSHYRLLSLDAMTDMFEHAGLDIVARETLYKEMDFQGWAWRMDVPAAVQARLRTTLLGAPPAVRRWLNPVERDGGLVFNLIEAVIVGRKPSQPVGTDHGLSG